ncbi:MAG: hypothetical protein Q9170_000856 [Blastenia crenularia]
MNITNCPEQGPQPPATLPGASPAEPTSLPAPLEEKIFPFCKLSGEIRNQIYTDIIGPKVPRPKIFKEIKWREVNVGPRFWPDRKFNTAIFLLSRRTHQEFMHVLWDILGVEWEVDDSKLDQKDVRLFTSMRLLQRCKIIIDTYKFGPVYLGGDWDVELTVFGLAHKINRMPHLEQIHLEYIEDEDSYTDHYFVRFQDHSVQHYYGSDLKTVFGTELRGMKKVEISGSLCDECSALLASAMERSKEVLPQHPGTEPEKCIPRATLPQWNDKVRGWV